MVVGKRWCVCFYGFLVVKFNRFCMSVFGGVSFLFVVGDEG